MGFVGFVLRVAAMGSDLRGGEALQGLLCSPSGKKNKQKPTETKPVPFGT